MSGCKGCLHQLIPGIADHRRASIRYQRQVSLEPVDRRIIKRITAHQETRAFLQIQALEHFL